MEDSAHETRGPRHRTDREMHTLLRSWNPSLEVHPSSSHDRNDCLTDSILLPMANQGLIRPLNVDVRKQLCTTVRSHLALACGLSAQSYPFLSHDERFVAICQALRTCLLPFWVAEQRPSQTSFTCIVFDRFNGQSARCRRYIHRACRNKPGVCVSA